MSYKKRDYFLCKFLIQPFLLGSLYLIFFAIAAMFNCSSEDVTETIDENNKGQYYVSQEMFQQKRELDRIEREKLEKVEQEKLAKKLEKDSLEFKKRFKKIKKTSCKLLSNLQSEVPKELESLSDEINTEFWNCIENKMVKYVTKMYPFTKDFIKNEMLFPDGTNSNKNFYDLFASYIRRNPDTGIKIDEDISVNKLSKNKFEVTITKPSGTIFTVNFQFNAGKLIVVYCSVSKDADMDWQVMFTNYILEPLTKYPSEYQGGDHWDWDMIDAIK
jgi:hypothetical protein